MKFRSLNESILSVTNPQPELTQNEYIELLEFALESIAEELECDVDDLVEAMRLTPARSAVLDRERNKSRQTMSKIGMSAVEKGRMTDKAKSKFNHAAVRDTRIAAIRRGAGVGVKSIAKGDSENVRAETPSERHEIGREERRRRTEKKSTKLGDGLRVWSKRLRD